MTRPLVKTDLLSLDDARRIRSLFGTVENARRNLGLSESVASHNMRAALNGDPIRPETRDAIEGAWDDWRRYFGLRNDVIDYDWSNMDNPGRRRGFNTAPRLLAPDSTL